MEPKVSLSSLQEPATDFYPELDTSRPQLFTHFP